MTDVRELLVRAGSEMDDRWCLLEEWVRKRFGRDTSIEALLFLIGVQSRGVGYAPKLPKEEKQDLIMEGTHVALEAIGCCERGSEDADTGVVWQRPVALTELTVKEQEVILRMGILEYFEQFVDTRQPS